MSTQQKQLNLPVKIAAFFASLLSGQTVTQEQVSKHLGPAGPDGYSPAQMRELHCILRPDRKEFLAGERSPGYEPEVVVCHFTKGGVGKTTILTNIAYIFALLGLNVLFIDADPQYTSTSLFAIDAEDENLKTLMHLMFERDYEDKPITDALIPLFKNATLDVLAADIQLGGYDLHATNRSQRELLITKMLKKHAPSLGKYDIILVDTNPGPSQLNQSLMIRADSILVPVSLDVMSVKSLRSMAASLAEVDELAPKERTHMILGNMEQSNMNHSKASRQGLEESYPGELLQTVIPNYSGFRRQGWEDEKGALLLVEREPTSAAAQKLVELSIEVLDRVLWQKQPVAV